MKIDTKLLFKIGTIFLFVGALFSAGYFHFDEHFQILEFAGLKLGLTQESNLPWEYHEQMRPALQPGIVYMVYSFFRLIGIENPFLVATSLRLLTVGLSVLLFKYAQRHFISTGKSNHFITVFTISYFFIWFLFYCQLRFSSENLAALFLFLSYLLIEKAFDNSTLKSWLLVGVVLGVSFQFRYQIGFFIIGLGVWMLIYKKMTIQNLLGMTTGFVGVFFIGFLIDSWFYEESVFPFWNYFYQNIMLNKVSGFGEEPWWFYFKEIIEKSFAPIGILLMFIIVWYAYFKRVKFEIWGFVFFILLHIFIGHKELRFLFPLNYFVPLLFAEFYISNLVQIQNIINKVWIKIIAYVVIVINIGLLFFVMFSPSDSYIALYKEVYEESREYKTTSIYYKDENLYDRVLEIYFYAPINTRFIKYDSPEDIPLSSVDSLSIVLHVQKVENENLDSLGVLVAKKYPDFVESFNIGNWVYKTNYWKVFKK